MSRAYLKELPCNTTSKELKPIMDGMVAASLAALMREPCEGEPDPQMLENEKLWIGGGSKSDDWLGAELLRIKGEKA
jgi:hypothetical protein